MSQRNLPSSAALLSQLPEDGGPDWNRLVFEQSPYLLQHASNPVDWHPWNEATLAKARTEDKPIFLSIGYATCHWCHVMAHESFEDQEVAALLKRDFIAIKVDREERPDIDQIYMSACQAMSGQGGWPLSAFLTPNGHPFFVGTYFPLDSRYGRIGMRELLPRVAEAWYQQRQQTIDSAIDFTRQLNQQQAGAEAGELSLGIERKAFTTLLQNFDAERGGFGNAPKFPMPHQLLFLLRYHQQHSTPEALAMVAKSLTAMRLGGVFDQIGLGFHRYSTDRDWLLPHFEKMLYDQAMLLLAYSEGYAVSQQSLYKQSSEEIFAYLQRRMTHPEGGFFSAEDADSEGVEGKFYVWSVAEIEAVLEPEDATWFCDRFGLEAAGNFHDDASHEKTGANIPHLKMPLNEAEKPRWERLRQQLYAAREQRIPPLKDDKILSDWNGLMIAALARAARLLDNAKMLMAAESAFDFICRELCDSQGVLKKRYRNGESGLPAHLEDYAFMSWAALELHQATLQSGYLSQALIWLEQVDQRFLDRDNGGYFFSEESELVMRPKSLYDGASPSGNSVMAYNLAHLYHLTGDIKWQQRYHNLTRAFAQEINHHPAGYTLLLMAQQLFQAPVQNLVLVSESEEIDFTLLQPLRKQFQPNRLYLLITPENRQKISGLAPFTAQQQAQDRLTLYLCQGFACEMPVIGIDAIEARLADLT